MSYTPGDFIENAWQDQQHLTETGVRMHLNVRQTASTRERLAFITGKLIQQQQHLHAQRQALLALQKRLEQQLDKLFEFTQDTLD